MDFKSRRTLVPAVSAFKIGSKWRLTCRSRSSSRQKSRVIRRHTHRSFSRSAKGKAGRWISLLRVVWKNARAYTWTKRAPTGCSWGNLSDPCRQSASSPQPIYHSLGDLCRKIFARYIKITVRTLFKLLPLRMITSEREFFPKQRFQSRSFGPLLEFFSCRCVRHFFGRVDSLLFVWNVYIYNPVNFSWNGKPLVESKGRRRNRRSTVRQLNVFCGRPLTASPY